ncbi:hypothetical protein OG782_32135 [Streptomyces sp. NBC_00876]|uniref:hypothetical protein n=1 Tax=Streptomyces sp. NBC_00876 TaxID=2975853 RepID=UPI00386AEF13|nr:hypothetical protein OG782_32135 [Streptomyces sp. NBC_00876]
MTPLPGAPRGNAPSRRPDGPALHGRRAAARQFLAALILAVLAVAGGAPAAAGAGLPAAAAPAPFAAAPAGTRPAAQHTDRSPDAGRSLRTDRSAQQTVRSQHTDRCLRSPRTDRSVRTHRAERTPAVRDSRTPRSTGSVTAVGTHRSGPAAAPQPWAAAEHPRTPQHLPPPGPGTLPPRAPGIPLPPPVPGSAPAAPSAAADRFRAALPGVRGPPRAAAHRPGDLSPVPTHTTAGPLPPS